MWTEPSVTDRSMWWKCRGAARLIAPALKTSVFYGCRRGLWLPRGNEAQKPGQSFSLVSSGFPQPFREWVLNNHLLDVRMTQLPPETNRHFLQYISPKIEALCLWANLSPEGVPDSSQCSEVPAWLNSAPQPAKCPVPSGPYMQGCLLPPPLT